jgi:hypothetical protein
MKMTKKMMITKVYDRNNKLVHPLLAVRSEFTPGEIAKALGHSNHTTVVIYCGKARKDGKLRVPAEWVLPLSKLSGMKPATFRPDLYLPNWSL